MCVEAACKYVRRQAHGVNSLRSVGRRDGRYVTGFGSERTECALRSDELRDAGPAHLTEEEERKLTSRGAVNVPSTSNRHRMFRLDEKPFGFSISLLHRRAEITQK